LKFSFGTYHLQPGMYFYHRPLKEQWVATWTTAQHAVKMLINGTNFRLFIYKLILFHLIHGQNCAGHMKQTHLRCHTWWKPVEELGRCHITKANNVSFEVIRSLLIKWSFLLPGNKTTKLRLILTNFYYKRIKRFANRNLEYYRRNFINMSCTGNS
jgi:hypothetical protein